MTERVLTELDVAVEALSGLPAELIQQAAAFDVGLDQPIYRRIAEQYVAYAQRAGQPLSWDKLRIWVRRYLDLECPVGDSCAGPVRASSGFCAYHATLIERLKR